MASERSATADFLESLSDPLRPMIEEPVVLVVAHPDDETIGAGGQLSRFSRLTIVHTTDGAPADGADAARLGFADVPAYREARQEELAKCLRAGGVEYAERVALDVPDKEAAFHLVDLARAVGDILGRSAAAVVLTHAFEGGHADHDATAFSVHAAVAVSTRPPMLVEMPYYHRAAGRRVHQEFRADGNGDGLAVPLSPEVRALKQRMLDAHVSQRNVLANFGTEVERFRDAPAYDFVAVEDGFAGYEAITPRISPAVWREEGKKASAELRLGRRR